MILPKSENWTAKTRLNLRLNGERGSKFQGAAAVRTRRDRPEMEPIDSKSFFDRCRRLGRPASGSYVCLAGGCLHGEVLARGPQVFHAVDRRVDGPPLAIWAIGAASSIALSLVTAAEIPVADDAETSVGVKSNRRLKPFSPRASRRRRGQSQIPIAGRRRRDAVADQDCGLTERSALPLLTRSQYPRRPPARLRKRAPNRAASCSNASARPVSRPFGARNPPAPGLACMSRMKHSADKFLTRSELSSGGRLHPGAPGAPPKPRQGGPERPASF
jgi:hypothetical protein